MLNQGQINTDFLCFLKLKAGDPVWRRIVDMEVSNLMASALTRDHVNAVAGCLPSLQCGARTDDEQFDQMWSMESLKVNRLTSSSQLNITPSSARPAEAERRATKRKRKRSRSRSRRARETNSSQLLLATPDHPQHINIETLANTQNLFHYMEFKRTSFVRVTASVHPPVGQQGPSTWTVSDYNLEGSKILSVLCTMIMDRTISGSEETWQEEQEGSRMASWTQKQRSQNMSICVLIKPAFSIYCFWSLVVSRNKHALTCKVN